MAHLEKWLLDVKIHIYIRFRPCHKPCLDSIEDYDFPSRKNCTGLARAFQYTVYLVTKYCYLEIIKYD